MGAPGSERRSHGTSQRPSGSALRGCGHERAGARSWSQRTTNPNRSSQRRRRRNSVSCSRALAEAGPESGCDFSQHRDAFLGGKILKGVNINSGRGLRTGRHAQPDLRRCTRDGQEEDDLRTVWRRTSRSHVQPRVPPHPSTIGLIVRAARCAVAAITGTTGSRSTARSLQPRPLRPRRHLLPRRRLLRPQVPPFRRG